MEEEENPNAVSSTWPPPPPFWKSFTPENTARIDELRKQKAAAEGGVGADDPGKIRLESPPRELRHLQPPPPPETGAWRVFGATYKLAEELPLLEEQGVRRLFPNPEERDHDGKHFDRATILKRLAKSLLLNFLELTGVLAIDPSAAAEKITDIRDLFINFHHLINEYRPHQARESLIAMMQAQLDRTRAETNAIRDAKEKVERVLEGLGSLKSDDDNNDDNIRDYGGSGGVLLQGNDSVKGKGKGMGMGTGAGGPFARDSELWRAMAVDGDLL